MPDPAFPCSSRVHRGGLIKRVRGVIVGHGASAEILWEFGWGAAFIVVFGTLITRPYQHT